MIVRLELPIGTPRICNGPLARQCDAYILGVGHAQHEQLKHGGAQGVEFDRTNVGQIGPRPDGGRIPYAVNEFFECVFFRHRLAGKQVRYASPVGLLLLLGFHAPLFVALEGGVLDITEGLEAVIASGAVVDKEVRAVCGGFVDAC